jgi:hypothetical protein
MFGVPKCTVNNNLMSTPLYVTFLDPYIKTNHENEQSCSILEHHKEGQSSIQQALALPYLSQHSPNHNEAQ